MREWMYSSNILDLSSNCRRVVSFTALPLTPREKSPQYPFQMRLGGSQSRSVIIIIIIIIQFLLLVYGIYFNVFYCFNVQYCNNFVRLTVHNI
jgi:hypothetical protein